MGERQTYYYLKPKSGNSRVVFGKSDTGLATPVRTQTRPAMATASVVDMNFADHTVSRVFSWMGVVRAGLVVMLSTVLYVGGLLVYDGANNLKDHITDLSLRGMDKLSAAAVAMSDQDLLAAQSNFVAAENLFASAQAEVLALGQTNLYLSGLASDRSRVVAGQQLIDSGVNLAQAGQILLSATQPIFQYLNGATTSDVVVDDFTLQMVNLLQAGTKDFDLAIAKINKATGLLGEVSPAIVGTAYASALTEAQTKTAHLQSMMNVLSVLAKELPDALGFKNPRHYLFLNQNNNELRATGGFVGSFAWVEIYQGKIQDIKVDITQRIDGQLGTAGEAMMPAPLRAVTTQFGTRDSNWYLDFPTSAINFQTLYERAGGGTADGIIAINPTLIEDILRIFGPVYLAGKDLTITAENFVEKTQHQIELVDNDKENPKEILNELSPLMMERLMAANQTQLQAVYGQILARIASKDILIYSRNPKLQGAVQTLNAAGTVPVAVSGDFLAVVQSNLGGTKSSQNLIEEISHTAKLNLTNEVTDYLTLKYTHTGVNEFPDGVNKNYLRVYVPLGSQLLTHAGQDYGTEVEIYEESEKTVFAFWVTTAPSESSQLDLTYTLPAEHSSEGHYALHIQKQAGANNTRLRSVVQLSPALQFLDGNKVKSLFSDKLNSDLDLGVDYTRLD